MQPKQLYTFLMGALAVAGLAYGLFWQFGETSQMVFNGPAPLGAGSASCPSFSDGTNSAVNVSAATSTVVLAADGNRAFVSIVKADSGDLWLSLGSTANASSGILLSGKGAVFTSCEYKGPITAVAVGATSTVGITYK